MPSFDAELTQLKAVQDKNITGLVLQGKKQFDDISGLVETNAAGIVTSKLILQLNRNDILKPL